MTFNDGQGGVIRFGMAQRPGASSDPRLDWFREARFGMFIHWGLYAIPAGRWKGQAIPGIGEWIQLRARIPNAEYEQLAKQFNPTQFDAEAWVSLAKRAGQKYLTITAKHHDGFCMYDSKVTEYDVVDATPFGRDPMKELAEACGRHGIKLCFYYSQTQDWHHPDGHANDWDFDPAKKDFEGYVREYVKPQVRELLTQYGPIGLIWFDTPLIISRELSQELVDLVHEIQPACLVNGRIGNDIGDYAETRDNVVPEDLIEADWENPATINDTWGFKSDDHNWKSTETLIQKLVDIVSKNGNYLLNVGPTADGVIPQPSVERLEAIGRWLETHGESVYGTGAGPLQGLAWARTTAKPGTVYLHVFDWPAGGTLTVPALPQKVTSARLLADPSAGPLAVSEGADGLTIQGPAGAPDPADSVVVLTLAG
ncbi:MAG TPA: alpha-L-fucosidase [Chloroflexota bacterium]|nr:alpha-L-fucosidase [Chloroflexota bacterium]